MLSLRYPTDLILLQLVHWDVPTQKSATLLFCILHPFKTLYWRKINVIILLFCECIGLATCIFKISYSWDCIMYLLALSLCNEAWKQACLLSCMEYVTQGLLAYTSTFIDLLMCYSKIISLAGKRHTRKTQGNVSCMGLLFSSLEHGAYFMSLEKEREYDLFLLSFRYAQ